jgi:glycosyltransferase involved in cell wall biosynthesis
MQQTSERDGNLDHVTVDVSKVPFTFSTARYSNLKDLQAHLCKAAVVLASVDHEQVSVAKACRQLGVPCVYVSEYSLVTRHQIIDATAPNPIIRLRRRIWASGVERQQRRAIASATGIQCNGTPTFEAYRDLTPSPLLYFDTRVTPDLLISQDALQARLARAGREGPIRLAYSGRLDKMKGADHLPKIAGTLAAEGVEFTLDIFGDGECRRKIEEEIARSDLGGRVRLRGVLDFSRQLMPELSRNVDLAIMPHPQGDPSCTYLETLSAGVPIAGYQNEAWSGVQRVAGMEIGVSAPIGDIQGIAGRIAELSRNRERLCAMSISGRTFASLHTFDGTFTKRVEHLVSIASASKSQT